MGPSFAMVSFVSFLSRAGSMSFQLPRSGTSKIFAVSKRRYSGFAGGFQQTSVSFLGVDQSK